MTLLFTRILPSVFNHKQVESRGFINPQYLLEKRENLKNFNQNSPSMRGPAYDLIHHYQIQFAVLASSLHLHLLTSNSNHAIRSSRHILAYMRVSFSKPIKFKVEDRTERCEHQD